MSKNQEKIKTPKKTTVEFDLFPLCYKKKRLSQDFTFETAPFIFLNLSLNQILYYTKSDMT